MCVELGLGFEVSVGVVALALADLGARERGLAVLVLVGTVSLVLLAPPSFSLSETGLGFTDVDVDTGLCASWDADTGFETGAEIEGEAVWYPSSSSSSPSSSTAAAGGAGD